MEMDWGSAIQLSVITASFGQMRRQAEEKRAEIENQLKLKKAVIPSIKTIMMTRYLLLHEFQITGPDWSIW